MIIRFVILFSIILFVLETNFDFIKISNFMGGEFSLLELIQLIIILLAIIINIKHRKLFTKNGIKLPYFLRLGTLLFLFYEEISFLTKGLIEFFNISNYQKEVNLHNLVFLYKTINFNNIPILNISFNLYYQTILFSLALFFIAYGSYIPFLKNFSIFFLEKKYAIYFLSYFFLEVINSIYMNTIPPKEAPIIQHEFLELLIYIIFLIDSYSKFLKLKSKESSIRAKKVIS